MAAKLRPGHLLDHLLKRADAAGQGDKGIGFVEHALLAFVHVVGDDQIASGVGVLTIFEKSRNDADDLAAAIEHGVGDLTHQSDRAAAIDEADVVVRKRRPERPRGLHEGRVGARPRAAIDANPSDRAHQWSGIGRCNIAVMARI